METIIVASGKAGKVWAQGAQLGEQRAAVVADDLAVTHPRPRFCQTELMECA